jgi:multidrug efflux pump subunit AcrA (membrane-fusion protein)
MRSNVKETILVGLLLLSSSALTACGRENNSAQASGPPPPSVRVQTLKNATLQDSIESVGTLQAEQTVSISPQTASLIAEILVKPGDRVRRGSCFFA